MRDAATRFWQDWPMPKELLDHQQALSTAWEKRQAKKAAQAHALEGAAAQAAEWDLPDPRPPVVEHQWRKDCLVSGADTPYICEVCGCKAMRFGVSWPPVRTAKFKAEKWKTCSPVPPL